MIWSYGDNSRGILAQGFAFVREFSRIFFCHGFGNCHGILSCLGLHGFIVSWVWDLSWDSGFVMEFMVLSWDFCHCLSFVMGILVMVLSGDFLMV